MAAHVTTVEGVYAQALLEVAQEKKILDAIKAELDEVVPALSGKGDVFNFLCTPNISRDAKIEVLTKVFKDKVSESMMNFLTMVVRRDRQAALKGIREEFDKLYRKAKNIMLVEVTTAMALSDDQRKRLAETLGKRYGCEIEFEELVDATIIGGLQVRAQGEFLDGSLLSRLDEAKARLHLVKVKSGELYED